MCDICRKYPCDRHCPNSEEKPMYTCDSCGGEIYAGEHYFEIPLEGYPTFNICKDCMDDFGKYAENKEEEE